MLVNDLIHGLYPEAVAIGEDVSGHNVSVFSCCKYLCSAINLVGVFTPLRDWLLFFIFGERTPYYCSWTANNSLTKYGKCQLI